MQARLSSFLLPFRQELHLTPTFPSFNSRSPDLSHQNSFWGFRLFCWVIDADIALGIFGGSMLDSSTFWMKQKILDLSSNLQAQALILIQLNCQFPFSVQTLESVWIFQVFPPQQKEEVEDNPCFLCMFAHFQTICYNEKSQAET